ncbi:MAG: 4-hydroxybutyrate dehydrogenase [Anaerovoracaceae bacterium]
MQVLKIVPEINYFETFREFSESFQIGKNDIIITNKILYKNYVKPIGTDSKCLFIEDYGTGEPTDEMIDEMALELRDCDYTRIIAFGGGTIVDICKILALDVPDKSVKLFTGEAVPVKVKELLIIPTTCGTGSEVTNVSIAELKSLNVKKGLAVDETYADNAVLIPEALEGLPDYVFATSSIDAFIHDAESYLSPKASPFTEMYSLRAMEMIISGYKKILSRGGNTSENRKDLLKEFCYAANYAGIAFGNAGCGAVHALSYALGGNFHVPHGEANYQFFSEVFRTYMRKSPKGKISRMNVLLADILECNTDNVYDEIENILNQLILKKRLRDYGMKPEQIDEFAQSTVSNQQRLLSNNYVYLSDGEIREIFANLY